jgi:hypothetical protein
VTRYGRAAVIHCGDPVVVLRAATTKIPYVTMAAEIDAGIAEIRAQRNALTIVRFRSDAPCFGGDEAR